MSKRLTQYDLDAPLPNYTESTNEGFTDIFAGAKRKAVE